MPLTNDDYTRMQAAATRSDIAEIGAIGGASWSVTRASGDTITAGITTASAGSATGNVYPIRPAGTRATDPGVVVATTQYRFRQTGGVALQVDDLLTDTVDSAIKFRVKGSRHTQLLFPGWLVERVR